MAFDNKEEKVATNEYGFLCEAAFRDALRELGIPFVWSDWFEDHGAGTDCWLGPKQVAVNFTVISDKKKTLLDGKAQKCLERGVVLVVVPSGMVLRAANGSVKDLDALERELKAALSDQLLKIGWRHRMTREKAARLAAARRGG